MLSKEKIEQAIERLNVILGCCEEYKKDFKEGHASSFELDISDFEAISTVLQALDNSISKEEYNKIKEENEMLKQEKRSRIIGKYGEIEVHDLIKQTLSKNFISKEVIAKKKCEIALKICEQSMGDCIISEEIYCDKAIYDFCNELLEGK